MYENKLIKHKIQRMELIDRSIYFQYVVMPNRRSTAEAFQILISHAFGDAGSPYLIGVVGFIKNSYPIEC